MNTSSQSAAEATPPRLGLIACRVFEEEITLHGGQAPHIVVTRFLRMGLHDHPDGLRAALQNEIDALDARDDISAIIMAYALCGRGTAGLRAGRHPLVIPRAHDCITVFMGSKEKFACQQAAHPESYYYTPGWMRANRTPGPERLQAMREELAKKFEPEDVDFIVETERASWAQHGRAVYLDLGTPNAEAKAAQAAASAQSLNWKFERIPGDPTLLRDLLAGRWDAQRFQIIPPGGVLDHSPDDAIFRIRAKAGHKGSSTP